MTTRAEYRQVLQAMLNGEAGTATQLNQFTGEVTWRDSGLLVTAAYALAAQQRFADDESHAAIKDFVAEAQRNYATAPTPIRPLIAEGVTRAVLGEEDLLNDISPEDQQVTQMLLTYKIVQDAGMTPPQVDELLNEAEALVDVWTAEAN
jgi:hypothetical protein